METPTRPPLSQKLRAVGDPSLRLGSFCQWMEDSTLDEVTQQLEHLLDTAERFEDPVTESLATLVAWVSGAVAPNRLHEVANHAKTIQLFRLSRMLQHAHECPSSVRPDQPTRAIPAYRKDRVLTLGERKNIARRRNRYDLARLLRDPHPAVIEQLLSNPQLTESDVLMLVTLRPPRAESMCHLFRQVRWLTTARVRLGILQNPGLPVWQTVPLLCLCTRPELLQVTRARNIPSELSTAAHSYLERHPPVADRVTSTTVH